LRLVSTFQNIRSRLQNLSLNDEDDKVLVSEEKMEQFIREYSDRLIHAVQLET